MIRIVCSLMTATACVVPHAVVAQSFSRARPAQAGLDSALLGAAVKRGAELAPLTSLLVARNGRLVTERYYRGMTRERTANIKSASKSIIGTLVGIAIAQGRLQLDQPVAELLPQYFASESEPAKRTVTVRHLLTMTAGLQSTSFDNYGAWVNSANWVRDALRRPIVCAPGSCMEYSTGNSHVLSAILTRATGLSTRDFANRYLFSPLGTTIRVWPRDPQGIYLGGNEMELTPRQMLKFGQLFLDGGRVNGQQIVPAEWIRESWGEYATSRWNGHRYGLHWWSRNAGPHKVHFAWGYGGQFIFIVPDLQLVAVMTSGLTGRRSGEHNEALHRLVDEYLIPAARAPATTS